MTETWIIVSQREVYWLRVYLHSSSGRGEAGLRGGLIPHLITSLSLPSFHPFLPSFLPSQSLPPSLSSCLLSSQSSSLCPFLHLSFLHLSFILSADRQLHVVGKQASSCPGLIPRALTAERKGVFPVSSILILKDTERLGLGYRRDSNMTSMARITCPHHHGWTGRKVTWRKGKCFRRKGETFTLCFYCKCLQSIGIFARSVLTSSPGIDFFFFTTLLEHRWSTLNFTY